MQKLRVGIVGADANGQGWAPLAHFPALRSLPEFEIAALCTAHADTALAASARYGVATAYHDFRELVANADIDVVSVVVRAPNHHDVVTAALAAGKHVYSEWPLGVDSAQAEAMAALAQVKGVRAVVGLQARCDPTLRYVRDLVAQGYVGDVLAVTMAMLTGAPSERPRSRAWETRVEGGVSALTVRGIHSLDALCFCVGELAVVSGHLSTQVKQWRITDNDERVDVETPDNVIVRGTLRNGGIVSAHIATLPSTAPGFRMEIFGSEGTLHIATPGAPQRDANMLAGAKGRAALVPMEIPAHYREIPPATPIGPPNNVAHLYRRLANAIRTGAAVEPDFDAAVRRHHLIDAIRQSSDEGVAIALA